MRVTILVESWLFIANFEGAMTMVVEQEVIYHESYLARNTHKGGLSCGHVDFADSINPKDLRKS